MHDTLRKLTLLLFALAALIPLMNLPPWFAPAPWGQAVLVRFLVPLLGILFLARLLGTPGFVQQAKERIQAVRWPLAAFALFLSVYMLALLFSMDPHFSFWGDPDRGWGALNYFLYVILGLLAFLSLKKEEWKTVWIAVFAGAVFLALVAFAQRFALLPNLIDPTGKPHATLGNPILLGAYLTPLVFLLLGFALKRISTLSQPHLHRISTLSPYIVLALLLLLAIFFAGSRSAFLGLGAGVFFFLLFAPVRARLLRVLGIGFVLAGVTTFTWLFFYPTPPSFLGEELSRSWNRITPQGLMKTERLAGWSIELKGVADRPFLGYGPYNSAIGFNKHFEESFVTEYRSTGWWDTAHSMYLDIAAGTGFLGLGTFLLFLGALFWGLMAARKPAPPQEKLLIHGTQTALVAFLAAMIPAFTSTPLYLIFFLLCAYALFLTTSHRQTEVVTPMFPSFWKRLHPNVQLGLFGLLGILVLLFLYTAALKPLAVNKDINLAQTKADKEQCEKAITIMEASFPANSHFQHYHRQRYVDIIGQCITNMPSQVKKLSEGAVFMLEEYHQTRERDPRSYILLGGYLNNLILLSLDKEERLRLAERAEAALKRAEELSPQRHATFAKLAQTYRLTGQYKKGQEVVDKCLALRPNLKDCWQERVLMSIVQGTMDRGFEALAEEAKNHGIAVQGDAPFLFQFIQAYGAQPERYKKDLMRAYEQLTRAVPDIFQYHAVLAGLYRDIGEREKAIKQLQEMWRLSPTPETQQQINAFLQTLP
ncbi:MAG: hypothetical protein A2672_00230 [Candidatus Wildermuthbacteria bacterium RIFCSPHIGHO2_01_FULL_49_22b]|uniref:O-antigen ligase-related domain-containing protein n=1 Tax=Candidatus Wildermuthbacteria bacterium RIFCSPHIGHO2_01_FULL_49_22b TaxID=1802448 RepID=A0A1G2R355_9BACT|nr:MAG: hypothetical protein A2672_00230 [Candidatus Wildermuthbacteria bacterium RIFCSPHIGHO2_01_FULL_49_22b]